MNKQTFNPWGLNLSRGQAAALLAMLMVWGATEGFVMSRDMVNDQEQICKAYNVVNGESDNVQFNYQLQMFVQRYRRVKSADELPFIMAQQVFSERYNYTLSL